MAELSYLDTLLAKRIFVDEVEVTPLRGGLNFESTASIAVTGEDDPITRVTKLTLALVVPAILLSDDNPSTILPDSSENPGVASTASRSDHVHRIVSESPSQGIGAANAEGVSTSFARADHDHTIRETGGPTNLTVAAIVDGEFLKRSGATIIGAAAAALSGNIPSTIDPDDSGSAGVGTAASRDDHQHAIAAAAPSQGVGGGNAEGVAGSFARSDHDHTLRTTTGPTDLTIGAIVDGEFLKRIGSTIVSAVAAGYTDEQAQDAVGGILVDGATIDLTYNDIAGQITAEVFDDSILDTKLRNSAASSVIGRSVGTIGDPGDIVAADETVLGRTGGGNLVFAQLATGQIANNGITDIKLRDSAGFSVIGKATTGTGDPADLVASDETVLGRTAAGNLAFAQLATGQVANNAISDAKLRDSSALSVIGRSVNSTGDPADIATSADGDVLRRSGTTLGFGAIPEASVTNLVTDLAAKADGAASSTDNALARFDSTTGKILQNGVVIEDDSGRVSAVKTLSYGAWTDKGNIATSVTIDWNDSPLQRIRITSAAFTFSFTDPLGPGTNKLYAVNGTGAAITFTWPAGVTWHEDTAPTMVSTTDQGMLLVFERLTTAGHYIGARGANNVNRSTL